MGRKADRDFTDSDIMKFHSRMERWLSNNIRQRKWSQRNFIDKKLKLKVQSVFGEAEKAISLDHLLNLFLVVEDADFDAKDIETIRQLNALISEPQE